MNHDSVDIFSSPDIQINCFVQSYVFVQDGNVEVNLLFKTASNSLSVYLYTILWDILSIDTLYKLWEYTKWKRELNWADVNAERMST